MSTSNNSMDALRLVGTKVFQNLNQIKVNAFIDFSKSQPSIRCYVEFHKKDANGYCKVGAAKMTDYEFWGFVSGLEELIYTQNTDYSLYHSPKKAGFAGSDNTIHLNFANTNDYGPQYAITFGNKEDKVSIYLAPFELKGFLRGVTRLAEECDKALFSSQRKMDKTIRDQKQNA
ncbi:MAG: hypothetical protein COB67_02440 [SAR324 cluster bacterium]|uniref:Uncharacterized protein n=1 Tax=SAR324 cluster bacterium TaxID=2024889 RepID=A0A2A4T9F2_9DELT|nr:MAG: hypothetical protein COB67_02440 [SAR324 cluster bacterium]